VATGDPTVDRTPARVDPLVDRTPARVDPLVDRTPAAGDRFVDRFVDLGMDNAPSSRDETDAAIRAASFASPCAASSNSSATRASFFDE